MKYPCYGPNCDRCKFRILPPKETKVYLKDDKGNVYHSYIVERVYAGCNDERILSANKVLEKILAKKAKNHSTQRV